MVVEVQGVAIPEPYTVPLFQGNTSASTSFPLQVGTQKGLGLGSSTVLIAGRIVQFSIQAVDRFGNKQSEGGLPPPALFPPSYTGLSAVVWVRVHGCVLGVQAGAQVHGCTAARSQLP